ncbi:carboxylesterase/lipase family protein [Deinococcus cellulosilyticus]|uniref:Carboxylic ester hydrolase n=1 Tax=Deinococcus cellulosilyticus (strain DSM 18568 / NBRC 106333 / KACC 11606 / 5516J-15) TaxID=1223518 RepID=A0A511N1F3_DEIC1|nr:carboxylesterase family protein [Deinococcus cellulosilyticus]GEM46281.1 carboxylic ester hydrolase [Deinococcus cellulosilyticus NBRC 106333 = KACC 11606]
MQNPRSHFNLPKQGALKGLYHEESGIHAYLGIPYAQPPVGPLRWRAPEPALPWEGTRDATQFGPRAMQLPVFGDMQFRSPAVSEDCLYLNVWTPDPQPQANLPVLVYFHGGGHVAGDGSEPRYDGEALAQQGLLVVTVNYRLGVFGFLSHPELEGGNFGYLDQNLALRWVQEHIRYFGGNPERVTIAGESAGSVSVSAHMASPLSRDLFSAAIGSSGSLLGTLSAMPLEEGQRTGQKFMEAAGGATLEDLRQLPAEVLLKHAEPFGIPGFPAVVDGHFFREVPLQTFAQKQQAPVPLLVGWNSQEMDAGFLLGPPPYTVEQYQKTLQSRFGELADDLFRVYPAQTDQEVDDAATALSGDLFIGYSTGKWAELHSLAGHPVFRYLYSHPRPHMTESFAGQVPGLAGGTREATAAEMVPPAKGAVHSADIEYFMGNLDSNPVYAWTEKDFELSKLMQRVYVHFARNHDPNHEGLPVWPRLEGGQGTLMELNLPPQVFSDPHPERQLVLERWMTRG